MHDPDDRAVSARRQFLRTFFHDLATPLSAVSLHLEGASRRHARGQDPAESLETAKTELAKAFDLFEKGRDLLLSRPEHVENFSFDDWVDAALRSYEGDGVAIEGRTEGRVSGDRARLSDALKALVVNALESSPGSVVVVRERSAEGLRVRVENPGCLSGDDPEKLFAPRMAGSGKNWGMGLASARLYAADAGGVVQLGQNGERVSATLQLPEATN
ncbi:MAG: HAMP domain-containing sensor histidine kinase [Acidobacteriota bacterium]